MTHAARRGTRGPTGLVVERSAIVRAGMESVLRACGIAPVCSGATATAALASVRDALERPSIALVGSVADRSIAAVTRELTLRHGCAVVAVLPTRELMHALALLRSGALSVLDRESPTLELQQAVRAAVDGHRHLPADVLEGIVTGAPTHGTRIGLTPRERDVLDGLAAGRTNGAIAVSLSVSEETVKSHVARLFQKLGVHGRTEAVATALRLGLV